MNPQPQQTTKSSLSETNKEIVKYLYAILKALDQESWKSPNQVFFMTETGWDAVANDYPIRFKTDIIYLPIATVTRGEVDLTYGTGGFRDAALLPHPTLSGKSIICRHAAINYEVYIYEYSMESLEFLFDRFFLIEGAKHSSFVYQSSLLGIPMNFSYEMFDFKMTPSVIEDKRTGKGYIYEMGFTMKVHTLIGTVIDTSYQFNTVVMNIYDQVTQGEIFESQITTTRP